MSSPDKDSTHTQNLVHSIQRNAGKSSKKTKLLGIGDPLLVWNEKVPGTSLEQFRKRISEKYNITLVDYWDLHKWSIEHFERFWEEAWNFFGLISSKPFDKVFRRTGEGFLDVEWFPGMLFNAAENLLKFRESDRTAIIYCDETAYEETVSYAEMFEEVKLYAAAFRKHGLKKGDIVACYISNRKEAVYTYLAAVSLGAIFSGPQPYYGAQAASNIVQKLQPKFLISIDHHVDNGVEYHNIDHLQKISEDTSSLEKVIIIPTKPDTYQRDISNIRNSCFLREFLARGMNPDGTVPDIKFEQLPFCHPACITFTSGTSGLPKGPVHSAGAIVHQLLNIVFYWNLKPNDVIFSPYPAGWTTFHISVNALAYGVTLFLFAGNISHQRIGFNFWDMFARYKIKANSFAPPPDKLEKLRVKPSPNSNFQYLKCITIGGSPVKKETILYIKNEVKKDVFVGSQYGATELSGMISGVDLNLPSYAPEIQIFGLGLDIRCINNKGEFVTGEKGELVIAKPSPAHPIYLFKDPDNKILKETYLTKYPGYWCQHDEIFINPETRGFIVLGRSDDALIQYGECFGSGDIYAAIHGMEEIQDYICVGQTRESDGDTRVILFIRMKEGYTFTPEFKSKVEEKIFDELWAECVPQVILEIPEIPRNINNKRMESVVRKIVATNKIPEVNNIRNPNCLINFCDIPEIVDFMKN